MKKKFNETPNINLDKSLLNVHFNINDPPP